MQTGIAVGCPWSGGGALGGSGGAIGASIPAALSYSGGCVAWWDAAYSGGAADLATSFSPQNRIPESNATLSIMSGGTSITYRATGWRGGSSYQPCWSFRDKQMRATGSDIVNAANGLGKSWTYIAVFVPRLTTTTTNYVCGWEKLSAASFSNSCGITRTNGNRMTWGVMRGAAIETVDTAVFHQNAQILEVSRPSGNQIQVGLDNTRTAAVSWGSGTTFDVDGFSVGGWASNNTSLASCDMDMRALFVWNKILATTDRDAVYAYLATAYSGFELIASLGGSA